MTWEIRPADGWYCIFDSTGNYITACASHQRAQLIGSAPELANALHELLEQVNAMTEYYESGACRSPACQQARELLTQLGMLGPPRKGEGNDSIG